MTDVQDNFGDVVMHTDPEIEAIKSRIREMEQESDRLKKVEADVRTVLTDTNLASEAPVDTEEQLEVDKRSIYVGNVEYATTPEELEEHFRSCGIVNRVTIMCSKLNGHPKGYAYLEFQNLEAVPEALGLEGSQLRGRTLKVSPKRTNKPGMSTTDQWPNSRPRGQSGGGRRGGRYIGAFRGARGYPVYNYHPSFPYY